MTKIVPLLDRVVVERVEAETKTAGGILLPDTAQEKPSEGIVIAVGKGNVSSMTGNRIPLEVKVGDRVTFLKHTGATLKLDGKVFTVLQEKEIYAILEAEAGASS